MPRPGILYITYGFPYPLHGGMRVRNYHLIKAISRRYDVSLLSLAEGPEELEHLEALRPYCVSVDAVVAEEHSMLQHAAGVSRCLLRGEPLHTHLLGYPEMWRKVAELAERWDVRLAQIEHSYMAPYRQALPPGHPCRTILEFPDLGFVQYGRMLRLRVGLTRRARYLWEWRSARVWEPRYARRFDRCVVVSQSDAQALRGVAPDVPITVVDNGVDTEALRPLPEAVGGSDLLFVGTMSYAPNVDAVRFFVRHVLPEVRRRAPEARLVVVGKSPLPCIRALGDRSDVVVTGSVPDVEPYYARCALSVVPLRGGGGTRLKILESMALGRAVVSTSLGCEGLEVVDGEHLLVADAPDALAERIVALLQDHDQRRGLTERARDLVERRYAWPILGERLMATYDALLAQAPGARDEA